MFVILTVSENMKTFSASTFIEIEQCHIDWNFKDLSLITYSLWKVLLNVSTAKEHVLKVASRNGVKLLNQIVQITLL